MITINAPFQRASSSPTCPVRPVRYSSKSWQSLLTLVFLTLSMVFSAANMQAVQAASFTPSANPAQLTQAAQDLVVTKTSSAAGAVQLGETITYTIRVANNSTTAHHNILVTDALPAGTSYIAQSTDLSFQRKMTFEDWFNVASYNNNDGTTPWPNSWVEFGNDCDYEPAYGVIRIIIPDGRLRFDGSAYDTTLTRQASMPNTTSATLSFDYIFNGTIETGDRFAIEINDGEYYKVLESFNGTLPASGHYSRDISAYANLFTRLRFTVSGFRDGSGTSAEWLELDNVKIEYSAPSTQSSRNNIPDDSVADLVDGTPPNLVTLADAVSLPAGETLTLRYQVQVRDPRPTGVREITNTASVDSDEMAAPVTATISNALLFPELTLATTYLPPLPTIDDPVTFTFNVTNSGTLALDTLAVSGSLAGLSAIACNATSLEPGASTTCTATYTVTLADVISGEISFSAQATALDPSDGPVTTSDPVVVTTSNPLPPVASDDSTTTDFNTPVDLVNITSNDTASGTGNSIVVTSIDLDPLTPGNQADFTDPAGNHWAASATSGNVTFTPGEDVVGPASIAYNVEDLLGQEGSADLVVTVALPTPPNAMDDEGETAFNITRKLDDITFNDTAYGERNQIDPATIDLDSTTPGNQTTITASGHTWTANTTTGEVTFTPSENFTGTASTPYSVQDESGQTASANLRVTVLTPQPPAAADDSTTTSFNVATTFTNITANDTVYGEGNSLVLNTIDLDPITEGRQATLAVEGHTWIADLLTGAVTYTPAANFTGLAAITYQIEDELGRQATAGLIVITTAPPAPVAVDDSAATTLDSPVTLPDITANDQARGEGNSIVTSSIDLDLTTEGNQPTILANGHTWTADPITGEVTFTPAHGFSGTASIAYSVEDEIGQQASASLSVTVDASFALASFTAQRVSETEVALAWTTNNENGASAYRLLRAAENDISKALEVTTLASNPTTMTYQFSDTTLPGEGEYWYWLVKVFVSTSQVTSNSISVNTTAPNYPIYLPIILH
jgi:uncharacterized repeat protein (TIGR01451 family)